MLYIDSVMDKSESTKKIYFELIRIFAIVLVLFNHTSAFHLPFCTPLSGINEIVFLFISIFDKVAVPLFFMVSGALLLHKEESLRQLFSKRVFRYIVLICLFQVVQHLYALFILKEPVTFRSFLLDCVHGHAANAAVWFLYAYLSFILLLPFLRVMVKNMRKEHFLYLFALQLLTWAFVPFSSTGLTKWMPLCNGVYLYVLAGYYLEHRVEMRNVHKKQLFLLAFVAVMCVFLSITMCHIGRDIRGEEMFTQKTLCFNGGILLPCIAIFLWIKKMASRCISQRLSSVICALGGTTFTIMLFENMLRRVAGKLVHFFIPSGYVSDVLIVLLACLIGVPIGLLLKRIPGIRKLV